MTHKGDGGDQVVCGTSDLIPSVPFLLHHSAMTVPVARLSSFYLFYYAALGAFTPYWSLFLTARGMSVTAISVMMGLWYATRVVAPSTWTSLAAASPRPIRLCASAVY